MFTCAVCKDTFPVPTKGFKPNKRLENILQKDAHLSDEEKTLQSAIHTSIQLLKDMHEELKTSQASLEMNSHEWFAHIRRKIDLRREELKLKIDEIALRMISQIEFAERAYTHRREKNARALTTQAEFFDFDKQSQDLADAFRKLDGVSQSAQSLLADQAAKIDTLQKIIEEFQIIRSDLPTYEFLKPNDISKGKSILFC